LRRRGQNGFLDERAYDATLATLKMSIAAESIKRLALALHEIDHVGITGS
jgi:hypothetical protein